VIKAQAFESCIKLGLGTRIALTLIGFAVWFPFAVATLVALAAFKLYRKMVNQHENIYEITHDGSLINGSRRDLWLHKCATNKLVKHDDKHNQERYEGGS
jgi:hypothetical protein